MPGFSRAGSPSRRAPVPGERQFLCCFPAGPGTATGSKPLQPLPQTACKKLQGQSTSASTCICNPKQQNSRKNLALRNWGNRQGLASPSNHAWSCCTQAEKPCFQNMAEPALLTLFQAHKLPQGRMLPQYRQEAPPDTVTPGTPQAQTQASLVGMSSPAWKLTSAPGPGKSVIFT